MDTLLHIFSDKIKGTIEGFDRIVFKGMLKSLSYSAGMQMFLMSNGVLNKDYKSWILPKSAAIVEDAEAYVMREIGEPIKYIVSCNTRKETLAHEQQKRMGMESGLVGAWSCVESCNTFKAAFDEKAGFPQIKHESSRCKHLYFYYDHVDYGFMSILLQTWAPFEIQIAMNGREWLKRQLNKEKTGYFLDGNKFFHIDDYKVAQDLLNSQVIDTRWIEMLSSFVPEIFPSMRSFINEKIGYTWTLWQSEWAKDYIFNNPQTLNSYMPNLLRHALISGTSDRVLRYMGHPVRDNGQPHHAAKPELQSRVNLWYNGVRIRHWVGKNSIKLYNEQNVLRFEMTMNDPKKYRIHRTVEGSGTEEKKFLPMRKGIADIAARTRISSSRIHSFTEQIATLDENATIEEILSKAIKPIKKDGKRYRGLDVTGKDMPLLRAVADPKYNADSITNKHLRLALEGLPWANGLTDKRLSARISRQLRLLREHGIIRKLPKQHKYTLTDKGRVLTTALNQFLGAKVSDLSCLAA
jgi:hypothetical protein